MNALTKVRIVRRALLVFALVALLAPSALTWAQAATGLITNVGRLNVRTGPGPGFPVVTILDVGANVGLIGRNADASWVQIQLPGSVQGWVNARYVTPSVPISSLPIVAQVSAASARVNAFFLNVRTGPGVAFAVIGTLSRGDGVSLVGRSVDGVWAQIVLPNGTRGWVNGGWLIPSVPISSLPIVDGQGGGATPPGQIPSWTGPTAAVTTGYLNVRFGPDVTFGAFTHITQGQVVGLVGRNASGTWLHIQIFGGAQGWINAIYVRPSVAIASLPITG
jgi:uncharacterized protein YraI